MLTVLWFVGCDGSEAIYRLEREDRLLSESTAKKLGFKPSTHQASGYPVFYSLISKKAGDRPG